MKHLKGELHFFEYKINWYALIKIEHFYKIKARNY